MTQAEKLRKIIGERIRSFRKQRGLTQQELADKADLHHTFIAHIESGRKVCSIKSLSRIANGLNISVEILLNQPGKKSVPVHDKITQKIIGIISKLNSIKKNKILALIKSAINKK